MYVGLWHDQADGVGSLTTAGWLPSSRRVSVYLRAGLALTRLCCLECDVDEPEAKPGCVLATYAAEMICDTSCRQRGFGRHKRQPCQVPSHVHRPWTLSRALHMTVTTVIAGQVKHMNNRRTTVEIIKP